MYHTTHDFLKNRQAFILTEFFPKTPLNTKPNQDRFIIQV
jgi:hypothetical protein